MSLASLLLFAGVYFAAVATPGPGMAALVGRVIAHGLKGIAPFIAGYVVGDLIWLFMASTGLSVLAHEFSGVLLAVRVAGALYLLYIAWGLLRTAPTLAPDARPPEATVGMRAFLGSLSLTIGNPKVIVFFLSILPLALDLDKLDIGNLLLVAAIAVVVLSGTLLAYALAADRVRGWLVERRAVKLIRRATAGLMASVALAILTR